MTSFGNILAIILSALSLAGTLGTGLWIVFALKFRVDQMWSRHETMGEALFRRGVIAALDKNFLESNSPMRINDANRVRAEEVFRPYLPPILAWYKAQPKMKNWELALEIERHFGRQLVEHVCPALRVFSGECWALAVAFCREHDGLPFELE